MAISFCDKEERPYLRDIEKLIKQEVPRLPQHQFVDESEAEEVSPTPAKDRPKANPNPRPNNKNRRSSRNRHRGKNRSRNKGRKNSGQDSSRPAKGA